MGISIRYQGSTLLDFFLVFFLNTTIKAVFGLFITQFLHFLSYPVLLLLSLLLILLLPSQLQQLLLILILILILLGLCNLFIKLLIFFLILNLYCIYIFWRSIYYCIVKWHFMMIPIFFPVVYLFYIRQHMIEYKVTVTFRIFNCYTKMISPQMHSIVFSFIIFVHIYIYIYFSFYIVPVLTIRILVSLFALFVHIVPFLFSTV